MFRHAFVYLLLVVGSLQVVAAETIQLPVVQDNSIVLVDGEWNENAGQQARIRIKGNQHLVAMSFDTSAIKGKRIKRATLVCTRADQEIQGVTVSTIATPWSEHRSTGLTAGLDDVTDWGYPGARFPAVCGGNSFTLVSHTLSRVEDGKYHWDISPDLVHALAIGVAFGLAIHEHDADYSRNPTIFSREQSGKQPYLLVETDSDQEPAPQPATNLKWVTLASGQLALRLQAPVDGFAYEVTVNGEQLPRHNVPPVKPSTEQTILLRDLPSFSPEPFRNREQANRPKQASELTETLSVDVVTLNRLGARSETISLPQVVPCSPAPTKPVPPFPEVRFAPAVEQPIADLAVIPLCDKYDTNGNGIGNLPPQYRTQNSIYDGRTIRLFAAAGEVVGFQLLVRGSKAVNVSINFDTFQPRIDLWHGVPVAAQDRKIVDPLIPLIEPLELAEDRDEVIVADIYVPFEQATNRHKGHVSLSDGREVPIELTVLPFALPREASFLCEMNSYGLPDEAKDYYALQKIAYDHRVHANILHYSHNTAAPGARKSNLDMRLPSGRRMDNKRYDNIQPGATTGYWDDFTEAFEAALTGACFESGHRGPIAAPGFYLTFHESWPLNCRQFFNGNPDAFLAFDDPTYAETYVNVLRSLTQLAIKQEWNRAGLQVYFNNKGSLKDQAKAPWILDEPSSYWDYRALNYFGQLTDKATDGPEPIKIRYRIDISRPEFTRGELDGRNDLWVVSSSAFQQYRRLITDRLDQDGLTAWIYGTANHVHEPNRNLQAWALDAWTGGAEGLVPWQTVDKSGAALKEADQLGLFIFDRDEAGKLAIRHSLRLKAFREAQQLIEYLMLVKHKMSWNDAQAANFVNHYVKLKAQVTKVNEEDAGTTDYANISGEDIDRLKRAAAMLLVR